MRRVLMAIMIAAMVALVLAGAGVMKAWAEPPPECVPPFPYYVPILGGCVGGPPVVLPKVDPIRP
jgi:hypothetical protein